MNILLTDISSLTLDQQDLPLAPQADADSFAGLFSQQFPVEPGNESQGADIKGFLENLPGLTDTSEATPDLTTGAGGGELLSPDPTAIPINTNPAVNAVSELLASVVKPAFRPDSEAMAIVTANGNKGEYLPAGGNSLPANAAFDRGQQSMFDNMTTAASGVSEAIKAVAAELKPQVAVQAVSTQSGRVEALSGAINAASTKANSAADFVSAMNKSALPGESAQATSAQMAITPAPGQIVSRDLLADARSGLETRQSGVAEVIPDVDLKTAAALSRSAGLSGVTPQAAVAALPLVSEDQLGDTPRVLKGLRETPVVETVPARETAMDRSLMPGEKIPLAVPATVRDIPGSAESRNLEILAQQPANVQQPAVTLPGSAPPHPLTPSTQPGALPPHLETLTLARNSDSAEWSSGLSERVNWMINQKQNTATIRLDPPFLGKLDVHVKIADDATTVSFLTQNTQTRELIETASVRLRDFLQESGYQNVNVDVSQRHDQQQARSQSAFDTDADQADESNQEQAFEHRQQDQDSYFIGEGIVDTFA